MLNPIIRFSGPIRRSLSSVVLIIDCRWVRLRPSVYLSPSPSSPPSQHQHQPAPSAAPLSPPLELSDSVRNGSAPSSPPTELFAECVHARGAIGAIVLSRSSRGGRAHMRFRAQDALDAVQQLVQPVPPVRDRRSGARHERRLQRARERCERLHSRNIRAGPVPLRLLLDRQAEPHELQHVLVLRALWHVAEQTGPRVVCE